tara:strand:- start:310 stop:687 length:378 start_codon:yes stop_codon:yes gene_type:complete
VKLFLSFLIFLFPSFSYAEWTEISKSNSGDTFYLDYETIRKHNGFIYWWEMSDYMKPLKDGYMSGNAYKEGDCKIFRYRYLTINLYSNSMGTGTSENVTFEDDEWTYPKPDTVAESMLKIICRLD